MVAEGLRRGVYTGAASDEKPVFASGDTVRR